MSFQNTTKLRRLAELAASWCGDVSQNGIEATSHANRCTAQLMPKVLKGTLPQVTTRTADNRRKVGKLTPQVARPMLPQGLRDTERTALGLPFRQPQLDGGRDGGRDKVSGDGATRFTLRNRLLAAKPAAHTRRAKVMARVCGFAWCPCRRVKDARALLAQAHTKPQLRPLPCAGSALRLGPCGLIPGARSHLVTKKQGEAKIRSFRLDLASDG